MQSNDEQSDAQRSNGAARNGKAPDQFDATAALLRTEFRNAYTALRRSLYAQRQALGLALFDAVLRASLFACLALVGLALSVAAAILGVVAMRRGLGLLFDGAWWSDLVLAVVLAGFVACTAVIVRRAVHRSVLERTRRHLARSASPPLTREHAR